MRATGFKGASNKTNYEVRRDGYPFNLSEAGVVRIDVVENGQVLSSDSDSVSWVEDVDSETQEFISILSVEWGAFNLKSYEGYSPTVYAYKEGDTKGEVITSLYLDMLKDERPNNGI